MTKTDFISVKVEPEFHEALRRKSDETGIALSVVVRRALELWLATGELPKLPEGKGAKGKPKAK